MYLSELTPTRGTLILLLPKTKIAEFANSVDLDEVGHNAVCPLVFES